MSLNAEKIRSLEILDCVGDAVLTTNLELEVTYINRMAEILTGICREKAVGFPLQQVLQVINADTRQSRIEALARKAMRADAFIPLENNGLLINPVKGEINIEDSAIPLHDPDGKVIGVAIVFHDSRYSSELTARMADLALQDSLTGLLNRHAFDERFHQSLALARRHKKRMGLLFIDLDNFKVINDTLGHGGGDEILKALAKALQTCLRTADVVCRYGGDEFVVLLSEIEQPAHAYLVAGKTQVLASSLLLPGGEVVTVNLSIGISIYPDDGHTQEALLKLADAAMYRSKVQGKKEEARVRYKSVQASTARWLSEKGCL
ncbi:sensor domain-containing diguanylate cyclase [Marinospirillum alkaliphilum]|uniref:Diguanylate cyclase (GGDEF) domain-containing protein n=1 Tax=Marinospirillum alkaliphilum DSM 21637 TaxID=1122209 RepID=A0A1K1XE66_9GAMM|nr:sensor domain-containing diguanylate cyclase [Marinospirillum alkaliphilum]SFX47878.1 diguanylate cyclase (GGDEF) domain-containing protein [Marinospirillum alkaliphilum DSM 21637]